MNTNEPRSKVGLADLEINTLTKVLFVALVLLTTIMMVLKGFAGPWYIYYLRYFLIFSYMIPISLRVNLDLGKLVYSWFIQYDKEIPGTVVRSSTIPEELGRVGYLLTDKTGTLTQNLMVFKRIHFGFDSYTNENQDELTNLLNQYFNTITPSIQEKQQSISSEKKRIDNKKTYTTKISEAIKAIALCHNVTPVFEEQISTERSDELHLSSATSMNTTDQSNNIELLPIKSKSIRHISKINRILN
jgi:phospholipid-translocating ATPase